MAENVSTEPPSSEPAELSLDDAVAMMGDDDEQSSDTPATAEKEQDATDDEAAQTDEDEAEEPEDADASEKDAEPEAQDDVLIKMDDGSTITVSELKAKAATLETDNARISQEVANERRELQQMGTKVAETFDVLVSYLASELPPEPEPSLRHTNRNLFNEMRGLRADAFEKLQSLLQGKQGVESVTSQLSEIDFKREEAEENAKLIAAVPNLKDPARLAAANAKVLAYGLSIGFSEKEIKNTLDARIRRMAIDAAYGRDAREAAQKAKVQVKTAMASKPAATGIRPHANSMKAIERVNAVKRLQKTGSLADAMKLDFA